MFLRYTVLLASKEHHPGPPEDPLILLIIHPSCQELLTPSTFQHHQPDHKFLQNAFFRLLPPALGDPPAPHGQLRYRGKEAVHMPALWILYKPGANNHTIGPVYIPQPSITYTNFLTCKQSQLPIGPAKNSCCDHAIPGVESRASNDPVNISYNDYTNKYKCHEVPYTN
ncbi:hypothetical protein MJO28_006761 [Puccinia striiformis f. sp. tritici]|uniref:Uncharacterized protein n=1 Tax=Puccinia striiformis f. sp. tritici TaxID=168172 RepID=A0ACC0EJ50_9BASI|nr:hypothetical protein MJO28_006761 [Puccinia striiformis f. sp. tritici]